MKMKWFLMGAVGAGIAAQLAVPAWMIARQEWILRNGTRVYFEAAAVDPLDLLRGRYVEIRLQAFERDFSSFERSGRFHAVVETNAQGVAYVNAVSTSESDALFITLKRKDYGAAAHNPFNRFYMPEKLAPVAEEIYRESVRQGATNSVMLAVRLHKGRGVVEDLLVNGVPMTQAAREKLKRRGAFAESGAR